MKKLLLIILILCIQFSNAQVGIGTESPNQSAQLELLSSDKGLLIPRIQLKGTTDVSTIVNGNVESLLVYNTANTLDVTKGFYYWAGTQWKKIVTESVVDEINTLADGKLYLGDGSNNAVEVSINGDATITSTGELNIAEDAVTAVNILDGAITKTKLITATTAADNGKVLRIKSDGSGLEWKVANAGGVLYIEDFTQKDATPVAHQLTKQALGANVNNFKVSLNGGVISPSNIRYDPIENTIEIRGIRVYNYDIVTVAYTIKNEPEQLEQLEQLEMK